MTKKTSKVRRAATDIPHPLNTRSATEIRLESIEERLIEMREMLVALLQQGGDERAGAKYGQLLFGQESLIPLSEAIGIVWGKTVTKDAESAQAHEEILKGWCTHGIGGIVLETTISRGHWMTSRKAVARFQAALHDRRKQSSKH